MRHSLMRWCVVGCLLVAGMAEGRAPAPETTGPVLDKATREEVRKRQEKRRDLLRQALESHLQLYRASRVEMNAVMGTSKQLLTAELDLATTKAERIAAYERQLKTAQTLVEVAKARQEAGRSTGADVLDSEAFALGVEIGLLKAGGKLKKEEK
jgi:outer membrane protein TolC